MLVAPWRDSGISLLEVRGRGEVSGVQQAVDAIYLDHAACAPLAEGVREAMREASEVGWANPSSVHGAGRKAKRLLERAREQVAEAMGARPADVVFTSGGSEACCAGIEGLHRRLRTSEQQTCFLTSSIEHPAVRESLEAISARGGASVQVLAPDAQVSGDLQPSTSLATQWINHETGVVLPVQAWADAVRNVDGLVFIDASQALGKVPFEADETPFDALAVGGSKIGGPTGIGALWLRRGGDFEPLVRGGGQERARRGGTQNVIGAVGFGAACAKLSDHLAAQDRVTALRDRLERRLVEHVGARVNGAARPRCGSIANVWFEGVHAQRLVAALDIEGLCVSAGSACSAGIAEPSPVIRALEPEPSARASESIRFSLGPSTREEQVERALSIVISVLSRFKT